MKKKKSTNYLDISERKSVLKIADVLGVFLGLYFVSNQFSNSYSLFYKENSILWVSVFIIYFLLFGNIFEIYNLKISSSRYAILRSVSVTTLATLIFYVLTPFITPVLPSDRIVLVYMYGSIMLPVIFFRFLYIQFVFTPKFFKRIIIIGGHIEVQQILKVIQKKYFQLNIVGCISDKKIEGFEDIRFFNINKVNVIDLVNDENIDEVIVSPSSLEKQDYVGINNQMIYLFEHGINIKGIEKLYEEITLCVAKENLNQNFYKNISFSQNHENSFYLFFGRVFDIIFALIGLLFLVTIIPFVVIGNLFGNKGPLFYQQERVGKKGENFKIVKFRSMVINAESNGAVWAKKNDTRITVFGKFLRKTRFDEIPQFWNILIGEMSLIGPRPERPGFVEELKKENPFYAIRHVIRPGLTGWAQVMFPYANTAEEQEIKLRYDLYYIKSRGVYMDFKILIKTISTVVHLKGQ
jgi:exopolysaccharide biosynthesis polyprenyl glycosylphosphotransferase